MEYLYKNFTSSKNNGKALFSQNLSLWYLNQGDLKLLNFGFRVYIPKIDEYRSIDYIE